METPIKNIVETIQLTHKDALLPLFECIVNSIISINQTGDSPLEKLIEVEIIRGQFPFQANLANIKTIKSVIIRDNGIGFTEKNYTSFATPFTKLYREDFGCKGVGRFTVLAAFEKISVSSNYIENGEWYVRSFTCDSENEIIGLDLKKSIKQIHETEVKILECFNSTIKDKTAQDISDIAFAITEHCLIYYLNNTLPTIKIIDQETGKFENINDLFKQVSKEKERTFKVGNHQFKAYITKSAKERNRRNHYIYYCANSRVVGDPKSIGSFNSLFTYPILKNGQQYFLDVYVVSDYLNKYANMARNGFLIPLQKEPLFNNADNVSFEEIENNLTRILEEEYEPHVKETLEKSIDDIKNYIRTQAPRYRSFLNNKDVLSTIPANLPDEKKEEFLYRISFNARKEIDDQLQNIIDNKQINETNIVQIKQDIQKKTAYDSDSLADYMIRRKAIIELFDRFLEADKEGKYKLEEDIHSIIFPMGLTGQEINYESHNLWLLDERFVTYHFIGSNKSLTSISQKSSSKRPDIMMVNEKEEPLMFDNPISFGNQSSGDVSSLVIFEFKRPGETAHQKHKGDFRWQFSELIDPYFDDFLYSQDKKNYKGKHVIVKKDTPKFGFIIADVIPGQLEEFNLDNGWSKTPFGTYYKIEPKKNLHLEAMTFSKLIGCARDRHTPFFDKLFGK